MGHLYSLNSNQAYIQQAKLALQKVQSELSRRQLVQGLSQQQQLPHRLSNAQYFVHELYYYHGFTPIEISEQVNIKLVTVINLILETTRTLPQLKLKRLIYFYYAVTQEKIKPQCYKNTPSGSLLNTEMPKELTDYITGLSDPGCCYLMGLLASQAHEEICSQHQAANESYDE